MIVFYLTLSFSGLGGVLHGALCNTFCAKAGSSREHARICFDVGCPREQKVWSEKVRMWNVRQERDKKWNARSINRQQCSERPQQRQIAELSSAFLRKEKKILGGLSTTALLDLSRVDLLFVVRYFYFVLSCNPVYVRHVDSSTLTFSLSSHRLTHKFCL